MAGIFGYVPNNTLGALYLTPQTGNEARWRQALANQGSISKTRPSLGGRLENLTVDTLRKAGVSDRTAARLGSKTFSAVNDLTPVGNLTGADEGAAQFGRGLTRGDLGQAALGAGIFGLSVFPGAAGRVVGKVGKGMFGRLMHDESGAIRAWHGSPHDFDRFSLDHMGSGEGAQAYGKGLYFAESQPIADWYRRELSPRPSNVNDPAHDVAVNWINRAGGDRAKAAQMMDEYLQGAGVDPAEFASVRNYITSPPGRTYEVSINAEPHQFPDVDELGLDEALNRARESGAPGVRYFDNVSRGAGAGTRNYVVFDPSLIDILNKY